MKDILKVIFITYLYRLSQFSFKFIPSNARRYIHYFFFFKTNEFQVPMRLDVLMNPKISRSLFINRRYYFESDVSLEVFRSFIVYWTTGIFPKDCINKENFVEHEMLSEELQIESICSIIDAKRREIGEELINISKIQSPFIKDKSIAEEEISKSFDDYF